MVSNDFFVGKKGKLVVMLNPRAMGQHLTADAALELAAWLVALAEGDVSRPFDEILTEVQNT